MTADQKDVPVAQAKRTEARPVDNKRLAELAAPYHGRTVGEQYLGPGWINDDGIACIVLIAGNDRWPRRVRDAGECALLAWRWNDAPSAFFSLTVMVRSGSPSPHVRWMRSGDDPVVQAVRRIGRFLLTVTDSRGHHSGWFEATFCEGFAPNAPPTRDALDYLWTFPTTGIPDSNIHTRFDPLRRESFNDHRADEIPLWKEPVSDFWKTMDYDGPWAKDLAPRDQAMAAWGVQAWRNRYTAAGFIQVLQDEVRLDGAVPVFDLNGRVQKDGPLQERSEKLVFKFPLIGQCLAALGGPDPNAERAHAATLAILRDPPSLYAMIVQLIRLLTDIDNEALALAFQHCFESAILDASITRNGTCRPWIANAGRFEMELKSWPIDLDAPLDDVKELWRNGMELIDLIDAGLMLSSSDFPAPLKQVCEALENVVVDGSIEDAETRVQTLLKEAQEARQWSIPWGARVEIQFGPFVAMRIFETQGEFTCLFLDDQERYFHAAIGLGHQPPKTATRRLVRMRNDDGEAMWNEDAEVSLKLVAAAVVRDFVVVEERESLFTTRPFRRRIRGRDLRTVIYLPRVRYSKPKLAAPSTGEPAALRARHQVVPHLRRAKMASAAQRFLAERYGMGLPEGFTFVRPHERGTSAEEGRIRTYRSRSASRMIFEALDTAPSGTRPAWFDFEKDCARILAGRGMRVIHQSARRDGDGGVDLYAASADGQTWVVQCKCWASHRAVGPEVVRELEGAIRLADEGSSSNSKGMIITTSTFTDGATAAATTLGFELINGAQVASMLATK